MGGPTSAAPLALTLYGRAWCHLCDDMRAALDDVVRTLRADGGMMELAVRLDVVDIDTDTSLEARYNEWVPVLVMDGVELCHHRLDRARVAEALRRGWGDGAEQPNPA
jgi:glutaredoxin